MTRRLTAIEPARAFATVAAMRELDFQDQVVIPMMRRLGWRLLVIRDSRHTHWASQPGWPDIFACRGERAIAIELKRPGEDPTAAQKAWHQALALAGVEVAVVRVSPDVIPLEEFLR